MATKKVEKNINIRPPKGEDFDKRIKVVLRNHSRTYKNRNTFVVEAIRELLKGYEVPT